MAQKWTILTVSPQRREVTMRNAAGKVLVVPMGKNPKDLSEQQAVMAAAQSKHERRELLKKVALGLTIIILIAVAIARS